MSLAGTPDDVLFRKDQRIMSEKDHYRFGLSRRGKNVNDNNTLAQDLREEIREKDVRIAALEAALRDLRMNLVAAKDPSNKVCFDINAMDRLLNTQSETKV